MVYIADNFFMKTRASGVTATNVAVITLTRGPMWTMQFHPGRKRQLDDLRESQLLRSPVLFKKGRLSWLPKVVQSLWLHQVLPCNPASEFCLAVYHSL